VALGAVVFSALLWAPLVRGITHSIAQMTQTTQQIAEGRFDARTQESRRDELGLLGQSVNRMAARLSGFVTGQKRFLGDVAHELCSPLARIQVALGILEQRADEKQQGYVNDVREEVQRMSSLVNELLSFSKASLGGSTIKLQPVTVREVVDKAVSREAAEGAQIRVDVADDLCVLAEPELLVRSLSNLLRNAIGYAGQAGPITVSARREDNYVVITVADCGPGVPDAELAKVFDPFYRLDSSRDASTGGVGLGLAIVKTCIESCRGTVACRNRQPSGLGVDLKLPAMPKERRQEPNAV
jgi:two-component system sensor histidine kinase CpxA